jgi:hypothetical protein
MWHLPTHHPRLARYSPVCPAPGFYLGRTLASFLAVISQLAALVKPQLATLTMEKFPVGSRCLIAKFCALVLVLNFLPGILEPSILHLMFF